MADNRARILATALELFNAKGTAAISTNHIAEGAAISPGNLYYHFRNKQAIIRALFEQQFAESDALYQLDGAQMPSLGDLERLVRATFDLSWRYRFIYRELIALLRSDDELQQRWNEVRARGFAGFHELLAAFVAAGVLRAPADAAAVEQTAELCWLISEYWLARLEASAIAIDEAQIERGVALMLHTLAPLMVG